MLRQSADEADRRAAVLPAGAKQQRLVRWARIARLAADIDLSAEGKATGFVRVPHSVHRSAYGWIPIPIVRISNGAGPSVLMVAGTHGDEWEGQIALGGLIRTLEPRDIGGRLVILPVDQGFEHGTASRDQSNSVSRLCERSGGRGADRAGSAGNESYAMHG